MENGEFDYSGGGGGGGGPAAAAAAAAAEVVVVEVRDRWQLCLMVVAALNRGHAKVSPHNERVIQKEDKRATQGEAMQQPANLLLQCHCDIWCFHCITTQERESG
jgi:hypothetical protein